MDATGNQQRALPPRKRLALAALAALALVLGVIALLLLQYGRIASNVRPTPEVAAEVRAELTPADAPPGEPRPPREPRERPTYVLVMGSERGGSNPLSTLALVRLARREARASVLWIPPRAIAAADGTKGSVSDAFVARGPAGAVRRVKDLTGLPVHHYVRFEASGIAEVLDAMGGVRVDPAIVAQPSASATAPPVARPGDKVLGGSDVLGYADMSAGAGAGARDGLLVVNAALTQAREKLLGPSALSLLMAASQSTETDMGPRGLFELGESMRGAVRSEVAQHYLLGPARNGVMLLAEESSRVRETVAEFASAN